MKRLLALALLFVVAASASADEAGHRAAALEMIEVFDVASNLPQMRASLVEGMVQSSPGAGDYRPTMEAFCDRHMSWDQVEPLFVDIYLEAFTEQELREIVAFYRTETGRKVIDKLPLVMRRGAAIGQTVVSKHQDELREMIAARQKELQGG